jgi:hypothetical protein
MCAGHASVPIPRSIPLMRLRSHLALRAARDTLVVEKRDCCRSGVPRGAEKRCGKRTCAPERGRGHKARRSLGAITARPPSRHAVDRGDGAPLLRARLFEERVPPRAVVYNRLNHGSNSSAHRKSKFAPPGNAGGSQRGCPVATGGRSASLLTVFFPTCSPPLSRNTASATAISAPRIAPNLPFRALLSVIIASDHPASCSQRLRPIEVPALQQGPIWNCGSLVAAPSSVYQK